MDAETTFWNNPKTVKAFYNHTRDQRWENELRKVKQPKTKRALDLGSGGGRNTDILLDIGFDTHACDYFDGMVNATRDRILNKYGKEKSKLVINADMKDLPYDDEFFDVILSNGIYHNTSSENEYFSALRETQRVIKPNGLVLVNIFTSDNYDSNSLLKKTKHLYFTNKKMPMILFSSDEVLLHFKQLGFSPIGKIEKYVRELDVGDRSVLKTAFKKQAHETISFPNTAFNKKIVKQTLSDRFNEIPDLTANNKIQRFGFAMTSPHPIAISTNDKFVPKNNNNVGVHTSPTTPLRGTRYLEQKSVQWIANLLGDSKADGYITSGGTEGNIMGLWIGREKLSRNSKDVMLVVTPLTHSSHLKAAKILGLTLKTIPLNHNYGIDIGKLESHLKESKKRNKGTILSLTAGYYSTGTSDNISDINKLIEKLKITNVYIHIDAAFGGFVYPFTDPAFTFDYRNNFIDSIVVDPHKMGLMPYSCGVFTCRKGLLKNISLENEHAKVTDSTIIGSRHGATAAALWALIASLGKKGYRKILSKCLENKEYLISKLYEVDKNLIIISQPNINNFAVKFSMFQDGILPNSIEEKYRLVPNILPYYKKGHKPTSANFYHFYLMPHVNKRAINRLVKDLKSCL